MNFSYFWATELGAGILSQFQYIPKALLLAVVIVPAFLYFAGYGAGIKNDLLILTKNPWLLLFLLYLSYLIVSTLICREITYPLANVFDHFGFRTEDQRWNAEIIQNILLFVPYSMLLLLSGGLEKPLKSAVIVCFYTSCGIEILQLILWLGYFQFSDIIHNTFGGLIGWSIWYIVREIRKRRLLSILWNWTIEFHHKRRK